MLKYHITTTSKFNFKLDSGPYTAAVRVFNFLTFSIHFYL